MYAVKGHLGLYTWITKKKKKKKKSGEERNWPPYLPKPMVQDKCPCYLGVIQKVRHSGGVEDMRHFCDKLLRKM